MSARWQRLLPGLWAGLLIGVAALAAPSAFAALPRADAGRFVARLFEQEAWTSLAFGAVLLAASFVHVERDTTRKIAGQRALLVVTLVATLLGYFVVQPLMPAARQAAGPFSFAQLHLFSTAMYALKALAVSWLAWRATLASESVSPVPSS